MTDALTQNPFAPPRTLVEDPVAPRSETVPATRGSRLLAFLIDISPGLVLGVVGAILVAVLVPGAFSGKFDPTGGGVVAFGLLCVVFFAVGIAWMVWNIVLLYRYGQTVGKKVLGIRVVRMDGSRVAFARFVFLRWLGVAVIAWIVAAIGALVHLRYLGNAVSLVDDLLIFAAARRCLHDYIADTRVVTAASSPDATLAGAQRL